MCNHKQWAWHTTHQIKTVIHSEGFTGAINNVNVKVVCGMQNKSPSRVFPLKIYSDEAISE